MLEVVVILSVLLFLLGAVLWAGGGKTLHEAHGSGIIETIPGALETSPAPVAGPSGSVEYRRTQANLVLPFDQSDHLKSHAMVARCPRPLRWE